MFLLAALLIPAYFLLATAAARDADARGHSGRWVGVAWVLCLPLGILLWLDARRSPKTRESAGPLR
jgi:hypothetical protein